MKNIFKNLVFAFLMATMLGGIACSDMLDTDTDHYLNSEGFRLNSPNDTIYSMVGILRRVQAIADRYVLVGELRGDLLDVTSNAGLDLQAIANFDFGLTQNNPYLDTRPYYDVINNCNFFVLRADTANAAPKDVMEKELAAVKTIRAWVYMQLVLNYGKACYYTDPILTVEDMEKVKKDPSAWINDLQTLFSLVEKDLQYARAVQGSQGNPYYDGLDGIERAFIPAQLVLADLYLYTGNYSDAAIQYNRYLLDHVLLANSRTIYWNNSGFVSGTTGDIRDMELITDIYSSSENGIGSQLLALCYPTEFSRSLGIECSYQLKPSVASQNTWNKQMYAYVPPGATAVDSITYTRGDLRGTRKGSTYSDNSTFMFPLESPYIFEAYSYFLASESDSLPFIVKYGGGNGSENATHIYRAGEIYLRLAEAINRLDKPSLAFAILKYGAMDQNLTNPAKVNPAEVENGVPYWNFPAILFPNLNAGGGRVQIGIHARGTGYAEKNIYYDFPITCTTHEDSVRYVDEMLIDEMAMETAFEGNRFHDLMRFAKYAESDPNYSVPVPDFLADRVANRRGERDAALYGKLLDKTKWYLPHN